jgi:hypothetical protein
LDPFIVQGIDLDQHFDCKIFFASGQLRSHLFETHTLVMKELTTIECVNAMLGHACDKPGMTRAFPVMFLALLSYSAFLKEKYNAVGLII